jgi:hypothetical protein
MAGALAAFCFPLALNSKTIDKPTKYFVRFVASSTMVRQAWGGNQDVYLVELKKTSKDPPFLAKLVDEYTGYERAVPNALLVSDGTSRIKARRDPACDVRYADMPKRGAPGDPAAVYPVPMSFEPHLSLPIEGDSVIQCYRLVRR